MPNLIERISEREDGWYWIRSRESRWRVGESRDGIMHCPGSIFRPGPDHEVGPRIYSPDERNAAPALMDVVKALQDLSEDCWEALRSTNEYEYDALRSKLAVLEEL